MRTRTGTHNYGHGHGHGHGHHNPAALYKTAMRLVTRPSLLHAVLVCACLWTRVGYVQGGFSRSKKYDVTLDEGVAESMLTVASKVCTVCVRCVYAVCVVYGAWCMVYCVCVVCGVWCMVCGA